MVLFLKDDIIKIFRYEEHEIHNNLKIKKVVIDSREVSYGSLFIAIRGENDDGHRYIEQACNNGAIYIICENITNSMRDFFHKNKINYIVVENTIIALHKIAAYQRNRLKAKVIGITGNIGKTTTREMFKIVLSKFYKIFSSQKNYNNHIGLPLTLCNTPIDTEILIIEMGMNNIGEIDFLTRMAKPDFAIITNITDAHIGNFKDILDVVNAKAEIFNGINDGGKIILNMDNIFYKDLLKIAKEKGYNNNDIISVGTINSDIYVSKYEFCNDFTTKYKINCYNEQVDCCIYGFNRGYLVNSLFVFAVCHELGLNIKKVAKQLIKFHIVNGRGDVKDIVYNGKHITIINDCYNSSPTALKTSLEVLGILKKQNSNRRVVAVIGDMLELGNKTIELHKGIVSDIINNNITNVVLIGTEVKVIFDNLPNNVEKLFYQNTNEFCKSMNNLLHNEDIVLFKASNGMHFENIIQTLINLNNVQ